MKKSVFFLFLFLAAQMISAQNNETKIFSHIGVSSNNFSGNFSDNWPIGTSFGAGIDLRLNNNFSAAPYIEYSYLPLNENNLKNNLNINDQSAKIVGGNLHLFNISANLKYQLKTQKMIKPYLTAGFGYLVIGNDDSRAIDNNGNTISTFNYNENVFSSNFGAGIEIELNSTFGIFVDARYLIGFTEDNYSRAAVNLGLAYKL